MLVSSLPLRRIILLGIVLAALCFSPLYLGPYLLVVLFYILIYIILTESYDIFSGYSGYMNLGHIAFFGIGGYTYAIFETGKLLSIKLSIYALFPAAITVAVVFAVLVSFPLFRLRGAYFALASYALVPLLYYLASNIEPVTGGRVGTQLVKAGTITSTYYIALTVAVVAIITNYLVGRSKLGLALISIREDEDIAAEYGIDTFKVKVEALMLSSVFASLAGAIFVYHIAVANPDGLLSMEMAFAPVTMSIFGGSGSYIGSLLGAAVITVIQELLWTQITYFHLFTYGILLILVGLLAPGGIVRIGSLRRIFKPQES